MKFLILFAVLLFSTNTLAARKEVIGIIKYVNGSWTTLDYTGDHGSLNISSVTTNTWDATINFSFTATKVMYFQVEPDETYIRHGIEAGASVGLSSARVEFAQTTTSGTSNITSAAMDISGSNLFIYGIFED